MQARLSRKTVATVSGVGGPDVRRVTTMWDFVQWAYQRELVRFSWVGGDDRREREMLASPISQTGIVCRILELGATIHGGGVTVHGRYEAHPDAEAVHAVVAAWPRRDFWRLVDAAESGRLPVWNPALPPARYAPVLRRGRPDVVGCPQGRRGLYCPIVQVGYTREEAALARAEARAEYARLVDGLRDAAEALSQDGALKRWRIKGLGVDVRPWDAARMDMLSTDAAA